MDKVSLAELRTVFLAGGWRTIGLSAAGGLFFVMAQPRTGGWSFLAATRGKQARAFRDPGKAMLLLHGIGVTKIALDISGWDPGRAAEEARRRPDVSARQRQVFAMAAELGRLKGAG